MADISLREYLEKVDTLLRTGKSDEVVLHARQILNYYPKNAAASRYLGQALVRGTDFREAEPVLRRVLAVYPDDEVANTALSDLNERQGNHDEAIWHLERALEAAPNDPTLVEKLGSLYQRHRGIENPRFQLTTSAVARQYIRNALYTEAIETLQTTLEKSPRRVDLRLLLAQTLWNAGMQVEAGETALDVIDTLPYCLEANRILTLLWLGEGRPSDAQRYLNQIQEVEPYLALQLAQNSPAADSAFMLPELDYRRIAETQIAAEQPDWLSEIDHEELPQDVWQADSVSTDEGDTQLDDEMPADFLTEFEEGDTLPQGTSTGSGFTGLLAALGRSEDDSDDEEIAPSEELPDWLTEAAPVQPIEENSAELVESDPLDWLAADDSEALF
ncbi:MAG: tetratricopeptide repeat protein, partial [Anaerolineae bacterium]|nr:tetratricopeptide repeat protein [Anaerolineae bacterium]